MSETADIHTNSTIYTPLNEDPVGKQGKLYLSSGTQYQQVQGTIKEAITTKHWHCVEYRVHAHILTASSTSACPLALKRRVCFPLPYPFLLPDRGSDRGPMLAAEQLQCFIYMKKCFDEL